MDATSIAIGESQWTLCLIQITGLLLVGWIAGRIVLRKFPDISASVGVVALAMSAVLIGLTWANVPRPFQLVSNAQSVTELSTETDSNLSSVSRLESSVKTQSSVPSWLSYLTSLVQQPAASPSLGGTAESSWPLPTPARIILALLLFTLLGGLVGIFHVILSSKTIRTLARSSLQIENTHVREEVSRIVDQLPTSLRQHDISVHQFKGAGSPFVSWLTGCKIFVPESFLNWSASEQSASLAHEIGHLQRRDQYCRLIIQLTFCLTWLHPLAWLLHRQTVLAQELAADQLAAQVSENPSAYCRGLSRLALRFDAECRHPSALGVSVSSSLIRRITMLREINFHRLPCSRLVNRCITLSAFVACTWIACWSVEGQTAAQEKMVDTKVVTASHTAPVKMFSQPTTRPWETIGNQSGYIKIQVDRILKHPDLKAYLPMVTTALDGVLRAEPNATQSFKQFGLGLDDIVQIQGGVVVSIRHDPKGPEGHRSRLDLGLSATEITAVNQVDWPSLIKAVDLKKVIFSGISKDHLDKIREEWLKSAQMGRSNVFQAVGLMRTANQELKDPTETRKEVWEAVSGGVVTIVYDIQENGKAPQDYEELDGLNQANFQMTVATETAGWGIDMSQDYKSCRIRFAAVPKAEVSTDDFLKMFEVVMDEVMKDIDPNEDEFSKHILEQLKKLKVSVVEGKEVNGEKTKDYLLVEGECSASITQLLNYQAIETE